METQADYRNRIVGTADVDPYELKSNPLNWRTHPQAQADALEQALDTVGYVAPVIVQQGTGIIVDGHLRVDLAISRGASTVPVSYVDLSDDEVALALATFDRLAAMAEEDEAKLAELLASLPSSEEAAELVRSVGIGVGIRLTDERADAIDDDDIVPPVEPVSQVGDIWQLGTHRLICGDSTDAQVIGRLLGEARVDLVWTDPPYGVAIGDKNALLDSMIPGPSNRVTRNLENDTLDEAALLTLLRSAFAHAAAVCTPGASWYVAAPAGPLHLLWGQALNELGIWRQTIIWVKNNATFAPLGVSYHWQAEPIFYGWLPNAAHRFYGDRTQTTVWHIDRPAKSPEHPTMKPVALVARAIDHSSRIGEGVLDCFAGSGTTALAAETLDRVAYLVEKDPAYADVIVQRFEELTGIAARRL